MIAAGGIYTGEDMYRMMSLGASGVQLGTRFVTTAECDADMRFKEAYLRAGETDIEIIKSPVGMPGRAISGTFLENVKKGNAKPKACRFHCIKTCDSATTHHDGPVQRVQGQPEKRIRLCRKQCLPRNAYFDGTGSDGRIGGRFKKEIFGRKNGRKHAVKLNNTTKICLKNS